MTTLVGGAAVVLEPLRVGIVLSGAAALGTFEAGVMHELLAAVEHGAPLTVDLIAGSSAGALVGALAVRSLVTGVSYRSGLRRWTGVTLEELTSRYEQAARARQRGKWPDVAILSSEVLRRMARGFLVRRIEDVELHQRFPAPRVALVMTLTNLDGLPGTERPGDEFRYGEAVTFTFAVPRLGGKYPQFEAAVWERVAQVALAGAAFPGAFDPVPVPWERRLHLGDRVTEEWENGRLLEKISRLYPGLQARMRYADGGILDNQPLERAVGALPRIVGRAGEAGLEGLLYDPRRCLLFVEPDPPVTALEQISAGQPMDLMTIIGRAARLWTLASSPYVSRKHLLTVNTRIERLFEFLAVLGQRMRDGFKPSQTSSAEWVVEALRAVPSLRDPATAGSEPGDMEPGLIEAPLFADAVRSFYRWLEDTKRSEYDLAFVGRFGATQMVNKQTTLHEVLRLLRQSYQSLRHLDPQDPERYQRLLQDAHISLALNLGLNRPWILLDYMAPENPQMFLRGEEVIHFGGFFKREFLRHDFEVGRYYARRWLNQTVPEFVPPDSVEPPQPSRDGVTWAVTVDNFGPLRRMLGRLVAGAGWGGGGRGRILTWAMGAAVAISGASATLWAVAWPVRWLTGKPDLIAAQPVLAAVGALFPFVLAALLLVQFPGELYTALMRKWWQNIWGGGRRTPNVS